MKNACISVGFYCFDKTPYQKSACKGQVLFYVIAYSSSSTEVRKGTQRKNLESGTNAVGYCLLDYFSWIGQPAFLYLPGSPTE